MLSDKAGRINEMFRSVGGARSTFDKNSKAKRA